MRAGSDAVNRQRGHQPIPNRWPICRQATRKAASPANATVRHNAVSTDASSCGDSGDAEGVGEAGEELSSQSASKVELSMVPSSIGPQGLGVGRPIRPPIPYNVNRLL